MFIRKKRYEEEKQNFKTTIDSTNKLNEELKHKNKELQKQVEDLNKELEHTKSVCIPHPENKSIITFVVSEDLSVKPVTKVHENMVEILVNEDYILESQVEDKNAIDLAFIVIANEVTDQIISQINESASMVKEFLDESDQT